MAGDTLKISVTWWSPENGSVQTWSDWPTRYRVQEDTTILLPFVGSLPSVGMNPATLSVDIAIELKEALALSGVLGVVVEITERRPIYVHGMVRDAGAVAYRPGMTVREAFAAAGGYPTLSASGMSELQVQREIVTGQASVQQLRQREDELLAKAARFDAEAKGATTISFPAYLNDGKGQLLSKREERLFNLKREKRDRALSLIDGRISLLENEIGMLREKRATLQEQQRFAKENMEAMRTLSERGLTANARLFDAQRLFSAIETQLLDLDSKSLAARQDIAEAERDRLELLKGENAQSLNALLTTLAAADKTRTKRVAQERFLELSLQPASGANALAVSLVHGASAQPLDVAWSTVLEPGDILEFTVPEDNPPRVR